MNNRFDIHILKEEMKKLAKKQKNAKRELKNLKTSFQEGKDYTTFYEEDNNKMIYTLHSERIKKVFFGDELIEEDTEYVLEEAPNFFSMRKRKTNFCTSSPAIEDKSFENFNWNLEESRNQISQQEVKKELFTRSQIIPPKK